MKIREGTKDRRLSQKEIAVVEPGPSHDRWTSQSKFPKQNLKSIEDIQRKLSLPSTCPHYNMTLHTNARTFSRQEICYIFRVPRGSRG